MHNHHIGISKLCYFECTVYLMCKYFLTVETIAFVKELRDPALPLSTATEDSTPLPNRFSTIIYYRFV